MCNDVPSLSVCLIRSPFLFSRSIPHSYSINSSILIFSSISQSHLFLDQLSLVQYVHTTRHIFFSFASFNLYEVLIRYACTRARRCCSAIIREKLAWSQNLFLFLRNHVHELREQQYTTHVALCSIHTIHSLLNKSVGNITQPTYVIYPF